MVIFGFVYHLPIFCLDQKRPDQESNLDTLAGLVCLIPISRGSAVGEPLRFQDQCNTIMRSGHTINITTEEDF